MAGFSVVWRGICLVLRSDRSQQLARQQPERYTQKSEAGQWAAATAEAARAVEQDLLAEDSEGNAHVDTTAFISLNTMDTEGLQVKTKQVSTTIFSRFD